MTLNQQFTLGNAFGTDLKIHASWIWLLPFAVFTLVYLGIEPLPEAIMASLLMFGSVLLATVARLRVAERQQLNWRSVTLFMLGGSVERVARSTPQQEARIEVTGIAVNLLLAGLFGSLYFALPAGALGIEMEIVALYNLGLVVFNLLLRLSPNHDNLLYAAFASVLNREWAHDIMTLIHAILLCTFALASIFAIGFSWLAFAWWFLTAWMLSQLTALAERQGEYDTAMPYLSPVHVKNNKPASAEKETLQEVA